MLIEVSKFPFYCRVPFYDVDRRAFFLKRLSLAVYRSIGHDEIKAIKSHNTERVIEIDMQGRCRQMVLQYIFFSMRRPLE